MAFGVPLLLDQSEDSRDTILGSTVDIERRKHIGGGPSTFGLHDADRDHHTDVAVRWQNNRKHMIRKLDPAEWTFWLRCTRIPIFPSSFHLGRTTPLRLPTELVQ
jgi:hypothetical protein